MRLACLALFSMFAGASVSRAQDITLSGVVKNNDGLPVEGATVHLAAADLTTTTGADGSFLIDNRTGAFFRSRPATPTVRVVSSPAANQVRVYLPDKAVLDIATYSAQGRLLFKSRERAGAGYHTVALPPMAAGVYFHRIVAGDAEFLLRCSTVGQSALTGSGHAQSPIRLLASDTPLKTTAAAVDTLVVHKEGYRQAVIPVESYSADLGTITLLTAFSTVDMVLIRAADSSFQMGSADGDPREQPVHTVHFTHDYWMDATEVTQKEYTDVMGAAYASFAPPAWDAAHGAGDNHPAYFVNWYDAALYCNALTKRNGSVDTVYAYTAITGTPGNGCVLHGLTVAPAADGYRLPTEAEWEYACRARMATDYHWGTQPAGDFAWYDANSESTTHAVGQKQPNGYGLYDMAGNVWEWCNDWYAGAYGSGPDTNPTGPAEPSGDSARVRRGGSFTNDSTSLRSSHRFYALPDDAANYRVGFRVVLPGADKADAFAYRVEQLWDEYEKLKPALLAGSVNPVASNLLLKGPEWIDSLTGLYGASLNDVLGGQGTAFASIAANSNLAPPSFAGTTQDFGEPLLAMLRKTGAVGVAPDGSIVDLADCTLARLRADSIMVTSFFAGDTAVEAELDTHTVMMASYLPSARLVDSASAYTFLFEGQYEWDPAGKRRELGKTRVISAIIAVATVGAAVVQAAGSVAAAKYERLQAENMSAIGDQLRANGYSLAAIGSRVDSLRASMDSANTRLRLLDSAVSASSAQIDTALARVSQSYQTIIRRMGDIDRTLNECLTRLDDIENEILYLKEYVSSAGLLTQINTLRGKINTFSAGPSYNLAVDIISDYDALLLNFLQYAQDNYHHAKQAGIVAGELAMAARFPAMVNSRMPTDRRHEHLETTQYSYEMASSFRDTTLEIDAPVPNPEHMLPITLADIEFLTEIMLFRFELNRYYVTDALGVSLTEYNRRTADTYLGYLQPLKQSIKNAVALFDATADTLLQLPSCTHSEDWYSHPTLPYALQSYLRQLQLENVTSSVSVNRVTHVDSANPGVRPVVPPTFALGTLRLPTQSGADSVWFDPMPWDYANCQERYLLNPDRTHSSAGTVRVGDSVVATFDPGYTTQAVHGGIWFDYLCSRIPRDTAIHSDHIDQNTEYGRCMFRTSFGEHGDGLSVTAFRAGEVPYVYHPDYDTHSDSAVSLWMSFDDPFTGAFGFSRESSVYLANHEWKRWSWLRMTEVTQAPFWGEIPREENDTLYVPVPDGDQPAMFILDVSRGLSAAQTLPPKLHDAYVARAAAILSVVAALTSLEVVLLAIANADDGEG